MISLFVLPLLGIVVLSIIHCYFGLHVIKRGVIFADLALSQLAALGGVISGLFALPFHITSISFTLIGAALFSCFSSIKDKVKQEVFIGTTYVVTAALCVTIMSKSPLQNHQLNAMLVGDILLITPKDLMKMVLIYSGIGIFHWIFKQKWQDINNRFYTFLFYASFGVVVTSSVSVAGVLLVFTYLIIPSQLAMSISSELKYQLLIGSSVAIFTSLLGILASIYLDIPTGSSIVCAFLLPLMAQFLIKIILRK
jgi:zinc/manganese transport system permease protein